MRLQQKLDAGVCRFWVKSARELDAGEITDIGGRATAAARYWVVDDASVGVSYYRLRLVDGSCFGDSGGVAVSGGVTSEVGACWTIFAIGWSGLYSGAARS
jgi:hypothetical protein